MGDSINKWIRGLNLKRFGKISQSLKKSDLMNIISEDNNIQIVNNSWIIIPGMVQEPKSHPILNKVGMLKYFNRFWLKSLLPHSEVLKWINCIDDIEKCIDKNWKDYKIIVIKHPNIDWNGQWVFMISKDKPIREQIECAMKKIENYFSNISKTYNILEDEFIIQNFIDWSIEWSITFSLQNDRLENWWIVENVTKNWEYFLSTNYFWSISDAEKIRIQNELFFKLSGLLSELQKEWLRWNIWFDFIMTDDWYIYIIECNWLHRCTGSTLPNNFCHNTKNSLFLWIPLNGERINQRYDIYDVNNMITLAENLQSHWTEPGRPQIMNIKTEWFEWNYPVSWISIAWSTLEELKDLLLKTDLLSKKWEEYVKRLLDCIK